MGPRPREPRVCTVVERGGGRNSAYLTPGVVVQRRQSKWEGAGEGRTSFLFFSGNKLALRRLPPLSRLGFFWGGEGRVAFASSGICSGVGWGGSLEISLVTRVEPLPLPLHSGRRMTGEERGDGEGWEIRRRETEWTCLLAFSPLFPGQQKQKSLLSHFFPRPPSLLLFPLFRLHYAKALLWQKPPRKGRVSEGGGKETLLACWQGKSPPPFFLQDILHVAV